MKKTFKKLMAALLAVALLCAMAVPAFAAEGASGTSSGNGSITINNARANAVYKAYKMFDVISSKTENGETTYVYKVDSAWETFFKTGAGKDYITVDAHGQPNWNTNKNSTNKSDDLESFAEAALSYASTSNISVTGTGRTSGTDGSEVVVTINNLPLGYYVIDTSVGALCSLGTVGDNNATIEEKNAIPTINKTIDTDKTTNDAAIGDTVNYTVTINAKKGATNYELVDTMTKGLTFKQNSLTVKVNGVAIDSSNYDLTVDSAASDGSVTFHVKFKQTYLDTLTSDTTIVVSYQAEVNKDALIYNSANTNTAKLKYGNTSTVESQTTTYSYKFDLVKTDSTNKLLTGAKFVLHKTETGSNDLVSFIKVSANNYRVADSTELDSATTEIVVEDKGAVTISGLNKVSYWLEETKAPDGYNLLLNRQKVDMTQSSNYTAIVTGDTYTKDGVQVINNAGATLPSTGGMGTTLFYVIGGGLMVAAVVLLVTKKRMENK